VKRLVEDMEDYGYGNTRIIVKSDQEPAIKDVISGVVRQRPAETIPEHSPVGDSKSNGMVENCCKRVQGVFRTLKGTLKSKTGRRTKPSHDIYPWMIEWAGQLITRYSLDSTGRSAHEKARGKRPEDGIAIVGESVHYNPLSAAHLGPRPNVDDRLRTGIWLGVGTRSNEHITGAERGVVKARTIRRRPE